jgi:hypothetical protein
MTVKKPQPTGAGRKAAETPDAAAGRGWDSFAFTMEEAGGVGELLTAYFEPKDEPALALLALLRSFTYTRDHYHREHMLSAVEAVVLPTLNVAHEAVDGATRELWRDLKKKGGEQK